MPVESVVSDPVPNSRRKVFFGLFVFPMLIAVTMAVLLSGVVLITHEEETPESLITAIKIGAPSKRWQKAFELSNELNREGGMIRSAGIMNEVIHILNDKEHYDAKTRAYMAMALGRFGKPEAELALRKVLRETDDAEDPKLALFLMWSIGNLRNPDVPPHLYPPPQGGRKLQGTDTPSPLMGEGRDGGAAQDVARFLESPHDDLRKTAAYVLGVLGDKKLIPALERALEDSIIDVRWNAALGLARLGDDSGGEILLEMLDRNRLRETYQMNEAEIERAMVNAAKGLGLIRYPRALSTLQSMSKTDPNLKVRQATLSALEQYG